MNKKNKFINILLISVIFISLILIVLVFVFPQFNNEENIIDFSKLYENEILDYFSVHSNIDNVIEYQFSDTIESGTLISQKYENKTYYLVISKGVDYDLEIDIPQFNEENSRDEIEEFFNNNHFNNVNYIYVFSELERGKVIEVSAFGLTKRLENIIVMLSAGNNESSDKIEIPSFINKTYDEVLSWCNLYDIDLHYEYDLSDEYAQGRIISQSIKAGDVVSKNSRLNVVVCYGKGVVIPNITNLTKSDVDKWIRDNNMKCVHYQYSNSDSVKKDYIISVSPRSGEKVSNDYNVFFTISLGPRISINSDYLGYSENVFITLIKSKGLKTQNDNNSLYSNIYSKDTIIRYDTGLFNSNDVITYSLSLGNFIFNKDDYIGLSNSEVSTKLDTIIKKNGIKGYYVEEKINTSNIGKVFDCEEKDGYITLFVGVKDKDKGYIMSPSMYDFKGTYDSEVNYLKTIFAKFINYGNVEFIPVESSEEVTSGVILSIGVKNISDKTYNTNYEEGEYICESTMIQIRIAK